MFRVSDRSGPFGPRLFALPPGADFASAVVRGLDSRLQGTAPEALARVTLYVNTRRMQRRIREIHDAGPARLLPRVRLITDLAHDPTPDAMAPAMDPLRRRLEVSQLVARLLDSQPDLAPRAALFDLSDSLAGLMDEMQGEGVSPAQIAALDVTDMSGHWARSLQFLQIVQPYFEATATAPDAEARQRRVVERLVERWRTAPPDHPVIIAGSTGSRGATALFLQAVARLPQGAVILPGFDFEMPQAVWDRLDDTVAAEDHPQYRFRKLMRALELEACDVAAWEPTPPPCPARNRLISLSLRPAPVTDEWLRDGPLLQDLDAATRELTLVQAPTPRAEAEVIALGLRQAVEDGKTAALITPDRTLTRQVAAALDRWNIIPDDSAGMPLPLSAPGRFLRQVADLSGRPLTAEGLLSLLKHPLCHSGADRNLHLLATHTLELHLRRNGPPFPDSASLLGWGALAERHTHWAGWLARLLDGRAQTPDLPLARHLGAHLALAESLAAGSRVTGSGGLWDEAAGREAHGVCTQLALHADAGGILSPRDYAALFLAVLGEAEVRNHDAGHPHVLIWGTLEARVQGADLVILGGMNEGVWPETPAPDPWLNRALRLKAGLLLPERRIGLSAHDYMQAVAGREVWITRAVRSDDAETVESRWINRLRNLLGGLQETGGPAVLAAMKRRGDDWLARARQVSDPAHSVPAATRPSPRPPLAARPRQLSVTRIKTLIRDPYAIYAEAVLGLRPLDTLSPTADAPMRGVVLHKVMERFGGTGKVPDAADARAVLMQVATDVLAADCPWPTVRMLWLARIDRVADWFLTTEMRRRALGTPTFFEERGAMMLTDLDFTLSAKADRFDLGHDGRWLIYDYKTGTVPSTEEQTHFDKQLLLESAMVANGAFPALGRGRVASASYIGLGPKPVEVAAPLSDPAVVRDQLHRLIRNWADPARGYSARIWMQKASDEGDFDHLSRFGEWDQTAAVTPVDLV